MGRWTQGHRGRLDVHIRWIKQTIGIGDIYGHRIYGQNRHRENIKGHRDIEA